MTGTHIHDRAAMYWNYAGNRHGLCVAHLRRDLAGIATHGRHQGWANEMRRGPSMTPKVICDPARARGELALADAERDAITTGYGTALSAALGTTEPCVYPDADDKGIHRDAQNLAAALFDYQAEILAFTANQAIPFDKTRPSETCAWPRSPRRSATAGEPPTA